MGNSDSKSGSSKKRPSPSPEKGREPERSSSESSSMSMSMEKLQLKQKTIDFIRKRVNEKGFEDFYALEILQTVIPDAIYSTVPSYSSTIFQYRFRWRDCVVTAESTNQMIAKKKVAAAALLMLFNIRLPVYDAPDDDFLFRKNEHFIRYETHAVHGYRAYLSFDDKTIEVFGPSFALAKQQLFTNNIDVFRDFDSKPIRDICRKTLMSYVISQNDPIPNRIKFVLDHLCTQSGGKMILKPTDGVLTAQEHKIFEKIANNMRTFYIFLSISDVEEYTACVELNGSDMFRTRKTLKEAQCDVITAAFNIILRQGEFQITKVGDHVVSCFMRTSYGTKGDDTCDISVMKKKVLEHVKILLSTRNTENNESIVILHKTLNYISYCETISESKCKSTIIWKNKQFSEVASDALSATLLTSATAVNELFQLPLKVFSFSNKDEKRKVLKSKIVRYGLRFKILLDGKIFESDATARTLESAEDEVVEKALKYLHDKGVEDTIKMNRRVMIRALATKDLPLLERINIVLEYMRTDSGAIFEPTDEILTLSERQFLITIEKKVKIEDKPDCFKATVNINDNLISDSAFTAQKAKNKVILAAYTYIEKVSQDIRSKSTSPEVAVKTKEVVKPKLTKQIPIVSAREAQNVTLISQYKQRFEAEYPKSDPALQFPSIVWYKITKSAVPIETNENESHEFVSSIVCEGKLFKEIASSKDESRHKVACTAMRQLLGVDSEYWSKFFEKKDVPVTNIVASEPKPKIVQSEKSKKMEAIDTCKKRIEDFRKRFEEKKLNPAGFWHSVSQQFPIKSVDTTSRIEFFDETFTETANSETTSRHRVAMVAFEKLFGISFPHWNVYKANDRSSVQTASVVDTNSKENMIKLCKKRAQEIIDKNRRNLNILQPTDVWNAASAGKYPIKSTACTGGVLSEIQFFDWKYSYVRNLKEKSQHRVAVSALKSLFEIYLPHWEIDTSKELNKCQETKDPKKFEKARLETIKVCHNRAKDYMNKNEKQLQKISPVEFWNIATANKFEILTNGTPTGGFHSSIEFFNKKYHEFSHELEKSRHKVATTALDQLFGITLSHWSNRNWTSKNSGISTGDSLNAKQNQNVAQKVYKQRLKDLLGSKQTTDEWTPAKLWHRLTQPDFPITSKCENFQCISTINFYDKVFTIKNNDEMLSRHMVAIEAFKELFSLCLPQWEVYKQNYSKSLSAAVLNSATLEQEKLEKIKYFTKRANEYLSKRNKQQTLFPTDLWYQITQSSYRIITECIGGNFQSKINFHGQVYTETDPNEMRSRHKVAASALKRLFNVYYQYWNDYFKSKEAKQSEKVKETKEVLKKRVEDTQERLKANEKEMKEIEAKVRELQSQNIKISPSDFWRRCTSGNIEIMSEPEGLFSHSFLSTINYFGEEFSAIHKNEQMSKDSAAALTLSCIFNVSFPHWNDYNPFGEVEDDKITKKTEEVEEKSVKQEEVGSVVSVPRPVKQKLEPEEIEKVLEELKKIAREIINNQDDISPIELWKNTVKDHPEYDILTEFHMKHEKYIKTIEFHEKIFTSEDFDEITAETKVACAAIEELLDLEFDTEDCEELKDRNKNENQVEEEENVEITENVEIVTENNSAEEIHVSIEDQTSIFTEKIESERKSSSEKSERFEPITYYEPLTKRIRNVLEVVTVNYLRSSFLQFKHSSAPVLTENEWKLLKNINSNIFEVNIEESSSDTDTEDESITPNVQMSVIINGHQIFGCGTTTKEARDATIIQAFEHIEDERLDVDIDKIDFSKRFIEEKDDDVVETDSEVAEYEETAKLSEESCIFKLRDLQKSLQERQMYLEDVPCSEIFEAIGIDFTFDHRFDAEPDPAFDRVKEMTGRFAIKKLLDLAYDIDY